MSLVVFDELHQLEDLLPEFDVPINTDCHNHVTFVRDYNVVDDIPMHVADLVVVSAG